MTFSRNIDRNSTEFDRSRQAPSLYVFNLCGNGPHTWVAAQCHPVPQHAGTLPYGNSGAFSRNYPKEPEGNAQRHRWPSWNLQKCRATKVNKNTIVLMSGDKLAVQPLADADFDLWSLPTRKKGALRHGYMCGVRPGPSADGSRGGTLNAPPPALSIASL